MPHLLGTPCPSKVGLKQRNCSTRVPDSITPYKVHPSHFTLPFNQITTGISAVFPLVFTSCRNFTSQTKWLLKSSNCSLWMSTSSFLSSTHLPPANLLLSLECRLPIGYLWPFTCLSSDIILQAKLPPPFGESWGFHGVVGKQLWIITSGKWPVVSCQWPVTLVLDTCALQHLLLRRPLVSSPHRFYLHSTYPLLWPCQVRKETVKELTKIFAYFW